MKYLTLLLLIPALIQSKVIPVPKEQFERCDTGGYYNTDDFEIIAINDTLVILNGTFLVTKDLAGPLKGKFYAERFERGQWTSSALQRKFDDFCTMINNKWEPWYEALKDRNKKDCPFPAGTKIYYREYKVDFSFMFFPYSYVGPWRMRIELDDNKFCIQYHFDFFDF